MISPGFDDADNILESRAIGFCVGYPNLSCLLMWAPEGMSDHQSSIHLPLDSIAAISPPPLPLYAIAVPRVS